MPGATERWKGAIYTASDGRAEPGKAAPALAAAARRAGATILTGCAVRGLDVAAGRVAGVVTEKGRIACEQVVLAGGAWSRRFCGNLGIYLPQLMVVNSVAATEFTTLSCGRSMPRLPQNSRDQAPPASTTGSQAMRPFSVTTPATRPAAVSMPRTAQSVRIVAPCRRAAAAIAGAAFCGSALPSRAV